jgi:hypothetical protein
MNLKIYVLFLRQEVRRRGTYQVPRSSWNCPSGEHMSRRWRLHDQNLLDQEDSTKSVVSCAAIVQRS